MEFAVTGSFATMLSACPADIADVEPVLVGFDKEVSTAEVEAELERRGLRAGNLRELIEFDRRGLTRFPFIYVALGSVISDPGCDWTVSIDTCAEAEDGPLCLHWRDRDWIKTFKFLAFPKS